MGIADEIEKLKALREDGTLSQEEFERAKQAVLGGGGSGGGGPDSLGTAANRFVSFQMVMAAVAVVLVIVFFFAFFLPHFRKTNDRFDNFQKKFEQEWKHGPVDPDGR